MNSLQLDTGGRPVANDDFQVLQDRDSVLGLPALLSGLGPCVVSGCRVYQTGTVWNVGPGMVWDGALLLPFTGRSNVTLPAMFAPGAVTVVDERAYQTGGTKTSIKSQSMDLVAVVAGATNLVMDTWGSRRWNDVVRASVRYLGEVQPVATAGVVAADYDGTGRGKPGSAAWGWALCNGQNGTDDLRGLFVLGQNPDRGNDGRGNNLTPTAVGAGGGAETHSLTVEEMPPHTHGQQQFRLVRTSWRDGGSSSADGTGNTQAAQTQSSGGLYSTVVPHNNMPPYLVLPYRQWVGY